MKIQKDIVKRTIAIVGTMVLTFSTVASAEESRLTNSNGVITINTADGPASIDADDIENNAQALEVLDGQLGGLSFKYEGGYYWAKAGTDGTWEKIGAVGIAAPWMVLKNAAGKDITFSSQSGVDIAGAMENYAGNKELLVTSEATLSNIGSTKYLSLEVPFTGYYTASGNALGASTTMLNYALPKLGDAVAANVLAGKYFTSSAGIRTEGSMADHSSDVTNKNSNVGYLPKNGANYLSVTVPYTGYYTNATKLITGIKYNPTGRVSQMPNKQTIDQNIGNANPNLASSVLKLGMNQSLTIPAGYYSNDIVIDNGVKDKGVLNWNPYGPATFVLNGFYSGGTISTENAYNAGYAAGKAAGITEGRGQNTGFGRGSYTLDTLAWVGRACDCYSNTYMVSPPMGYDGTVSLDYIASGGWRDNQTGGVKGTLTVHNMTRGTSVSYSGSAQGRMNITGRTLSFYKNDVIKITMDANSPSWHAWCQGGVTFY